MKVAKCQICSKEISDFYHFSDFEYLDVNYNTLCLECFLSLSEEYEAVKEALKENEEEN